MCSICGNLVLRVPRLWLNIPYAWKENIPYKANDNPSPYWANNLIELLIIFVAPRWQEGFQQYYGGSNPWIRMQPIFYQSKGAMECGNKKGGEAYHCMGENDMQNLRG